MRLLVIDGGATATDVALCDQNTVIARTEFPSLKPSRGDLKTDQLCLLLGSFLAANTPLAEGDVWQPDAMIIGMAGVWSDRERYEYSEAFNQAWTQYVSVERIPLVLLSDAELLLAAAHGADAGAVLIAGTGSMMLMRRSDGLLQRVGGWGPAVDDMGGGMWLGRRAVRAVARMLDGRGPDTLLIRPVANYLRVDDEDADAVRDALRRADPSRMSRLATAVLYYADEADAVSMEIRREGALELALMLTVVPSDLDAVIYGSLFENAAYRELVERFAARPLPRLPDVIAALAERIHAAGQLPMQPM
ncbi:MAG: hypothetical protein FGM33_02505 [Candidatus Kapabacteria bacterium]|nr:hypothetical protein [Candidatus Kapabacteria bacterium]